MGTSQRKEQADGWQANGNGGIVGAESPGT
jgi:hypothetical protein